MTSNKPMFAGFNSRSRVGSDAATATDAAGITVSIRAPAWGATCLVMYPRRPCGVSIRAPAWGATSGDSMQPYLYDVSIRAPAWGATAAYWYPWERGKVSIRAPAWGATTPA